MRRFTLVFFTQLVLYVGVLTAQQSTTSPLAQLRAYVPSTHAPLGDYVPCTFDESQRYAFRSRGASVRRKYLDRTGANAFTTYAKNEILDLFGTKDDNIQENSLKPNSAEEKLWSELNSQEFEGLTIAAAVNSVTSQALAEGISARDSQKLMNALSTSIGIDDGRPPEDVTCSFSILPWDETKEIFGRLVANSYIAIQVTIRNLNKQNEFLLHDIQVAVDTGLDHDDWGRFEAGRDKLLVRSLAQKAESDEVRNLVMNTLTALGAVAGGASGALTQTIGGANSGTAVWLSESVSVFQGPVMYGLNKIFPDHTLDNVNNLNDLGFSASSTTKTVIPVQGAVPLVTFVPQKPLGQLPFSRCGKEGWSIWPIFRREPTTFETSGSTHECANIPATRDKTGVGDTATLSKKSLPYKQWYPAALDILKYRTFVVVAGVHIQEAVPVMSVVAVNCPSSKGAVDISNASGEVSCTVTGENLGNAATAELRQGASTSVAATVTPTADGRSAILTFKSADFERKSGTFEIFITDGSTGKTMNVGQSLIFPISTITH